MVSFMARSALGLGLGCLCSPLYNALKFFKASKAMALVFFAPCLFCFRFIEVHKFVT